MVNNTFDVMSYKRYGVYESPKLIVMKCYEDQRGILYETFAEDELNKLLLNDQKFICEKISITNKEHTLRGLHVNMTTYKLMHVIQGGTFHVVVDMRKGSPMFQVPHTFFLKDSFPSLLLLPPGFANGFMTLFDNVIFQYKLSQYYNQYEETVIKWNDPELNIQWPVMDMNQIIISDKDAN